MSDLEMKRNLDQLRDGAEDRIDSAITHLREYRSRQVQADNKADCKFQVITKAIKYLTKAQETVGKLGDGGGSG